jgi:hypothetical protein
MACEIEGVVIALLEPKSGVGAGGKEWKNRVFVIETESEYPKKCAFTGMGKVLEYVDKLIIGQKVKVQFNPESREWEGRYFTDNKAWKIEVTAEASAPLEPMYSNGAPDLGAPVSEDDLPF